MIRGFTVLKDPVNFLRFLGWSVAYWGANGISLWVLARGFGLDLPLGAAFAVMGLVAVGITLPNSPGLTGQYQWFAGLGLGLYIAREIVNAHGGYIEARSNLGDGSTFVATLPLLDSSAPSS